MPELAGFKHRKKFTVRQFRHPDFQCVVHIVSFRFYVKRFCPYGHVFLRQFVGVQLLACVDGNVHVLQVLQANLDVLSMDFRVQSLGIQLLYHVFGSIFPLENQLFLSVKSFLFRDKFFAICSETAVFLISRIALFQPAELERKGIQFRERRHGLALIFLCIAFVSLCRTGTYAIEFIQRSDRICSGIC